MPTHFIMDDDDDDDDEEEESDDENEDNDVDAKTLLMLHLWKKRGCLVCS